MTLRLIIKEPGLDQKSVRLNDNHAYGFLESGTQYSAVLGRDDTHAKISIDCCVVISRQGRANSDIVKADETFELGLGERVMQANPPVVMHLEYELDDGLVEWDD